MKQADEIKRIWIMQLLEKCPRGKPLETCPLTALRRISRKERSASVWMLDDDQVDDIITTHKACAKKDRNSE